MTYLLETSLAVHLLRGNEALSQRLRPLIATGEVAISACTAAELYYGARRRRTPEAELEQVTGFTGSFEILSFDDDAAQVYAALQANLHQSGMVLPTMDVQIAAVALAHDMIVISSDRHFTLIPGLRVENWLSGETSGDS